MFLISGLGLLTLLFAFQNCSESSLGGGDFSSVSVRQMTITEVQAMVEDCGMPAKPSANVTYIPSRREALGQVTPQATSSCLTFYVNEDLPRAMGSGLSSAAPTNRFCTAISNAQIMVPYDTNIPGFTFKFVLMGAGGTINIPCDISFTNAGVYILAN